MAKVTQRFNLTNNPAKQIEVDFLHAQKHFFSEFVKKGFEDLFDEVGVIEDYTGNNWQVSFSEVEWAAPKLSFREAQVLGQTHDAPVYVKVKLVNKRNGQIATQKLFLCDMPLMSDRASFMINGNERVVVFQIVRSEGLLFGETKASTPQKPIYSVKLMPHRGKWYEFEVNKYGVMSVKLLEKRPRILLTTLLRAIGYSTDEDIRKVLDSVDTGEFKYVDATLRKDVTRNTEEALIDIYRKLRPEDAVTLDNAKSFIEAMFFNKRRFFLGKVGRYKFNSKLNLGEDFTEEDYLLKRKDIVEVVKALVRLNNGTMLPDDIDSLSNRRIRGFNESVSDRIRVGMLLMEKNIKDKMSTYSTDEKVSPAMIVNTRPIIAAINQFFGSSPLLRYMDQENIISELEAKRKITATGPRGLTKERATFSVRDVHNSHYGRVCPINTPEGPGIGMVSQIAVYPNINEYGFLEAPYYRVVKEINPSDKNIERFEGATLAEDVKGLGKKGDKLTKEILKNASKSKDVIKVIPFVDSSEIVYLEAEEELKYKIASATTHRDEFGTIKDTNVYVRYNNTYPKVDKNEIDLIDVSPAQIAGLGLALIPFVSNDDPGRSFYGSKTQVQAIPLVKHESAYVGTGFETEAVKASGRTIFANNDGEVIESDANKVVVKYKGDTKETVYEVEKFVRTNQNTSFSQIPRVIVGEKFTKGDVLVDGPSTDHGELALGTNLRAAFMVWDGFTYEDGVVISERLVKDDVLTSVHIQEYTQEVRETKLGDEIITRDIPGVGERALRNLDEEGIVRIGASVGPKDILVGIIAPKGETELTAEEKLLRAIFGEYARDVRDNSLRLPYGEHGVVIAVQILDRAKGAKLNAGAIKQVKVWVAKTHKISVGDKLIGFHGDKGTVAKIVPEADMPYSADGKPVDIILGPISMIKRMNLGQLVETHVSELAYRLGLKVKSEPFAEYSISKLLDIAKEKGVEFDEKIDLFDGRTGRRYDQKVTVGMKYFLKLDHLSEHKVHARSTGPYTLVTQQPLRGKAQMGGQRLGEMEVWALEAHAVPNVLHEMLTIKSDDVVGRAAAYKAIITGQKIKTPNIPESFNVIDKELAGLAIKLDKIDAQIDETIDDMAIEEIVDSIGGDA